MELLAEGSAVLALIQGVEVGTSDSSWSRGRDVVAGHCQLTGVASHWVVTFTLLFYYFCLFLYFNFLLLVQQLEQARLWHARRSEHPYFLALAAALSQVARDSGAGMALACEEEPGVRTGCGRRHCQPTGGRRPALSLCLS